MFSHILLVIIILILIAFCAYCISVSQYVVIRGNCGREYYVDRGHKDERVAADILCEINRRCKNLINYLKMKYRSDERVKKLIEEYDWHDLIENENESYNVNKGQKIHMCLRSKRDGRLHDINTLMFVVIHELAHIVTPELQHTDLFWKNNVWLLKEAIKIGIYRDVDYRKFPIEYCGINLNASPMHDI